MSRKLMLETMFFSFLKQIINAKYSFIDFAITNFLLKNYTFLWNIRVKRKKKKKKTKLWILEHSQITTLYQYLIFMFFFSFIIHCSNHLSLVSSNIYLTTCKHSRGIQNHFPRKALQHHQQLLYMIEHACGLSSSKALISFISGDLGSPIASRTFLTKPEGALMSYAPFT